MKKGVNQGCFPGGCPIEECFRFARQAGFDGVELNLAETGPFSLESREEEIVRIGKMAREHQVELCSLSTSLLWKYSLTDNAVETRKKGIEIVKRMIDCASILQIDTILVVPGAVNRDCSYEAVYERAQSALLELGDYAEKSGVTIAVENVWNKFLLSPLEMKRFVDELNHGSIGVYFDVGNVLLFGYPQQWIRILGKRIKRIHVKDFKTEIGNFSGFCPLLQGDAEWAEIRKALAEIGYGGYLTAEIPPYRSYPERSLIDISQALDWIITGREKNG